MKAAYRNKPGLQCKLKHEIWIQLHLKHKGITLGIFHEQFPLRASYTTWHLDLKLDEDAVRKEDIQIIQDWRCLANGGPNGIFQPNYSFGLEQLEVRDSPRGLPWWKFKPSSGKGIHIKECKVLPQRTRSSSKFLLDLDAK